MSGRAREGDSGRSIVTAVETQVPALAQLIRQATIGSTHSWLLDTERLTGLLAGSVFVAYAARGQRVRQVFVFPSLPSLASLQVLHGSGLASGGLCDRSPSIPPAGAVS